MTDAYIYNIFRLTVTKPVYNPLKPWQMTPKFGSGTGFAVRHNNRIFLITNYHVVESASSYGLEFSDGSPLITVHTVFAAPHYDLAIVEPIKSDAERFNKLVRPLEFASEHPKQDASIRVVGFPDVPLALSITNGIVSRYRSIAYPYSIHHNMCLQTTCAINHGNSGGPALQHGKVVGVAFMSDSAGEGLGFAVPLVFVKHVIDGFLEHKRVEFGHLGAITQKTSILIRNYYECNKNGILISEDGNGLKRGDIILSMDGHDVSDNATLEMPEIMSGVQVAFYTLIASKYIGETIACSVWRNKSVKQVDVEILPMQDLVYDNDYVNHKYMILDGICFIPLSGRYVSDIVRGAKPPYFYPSYFFALNKSRDARDEVVIISDIIFTPENPPLNHLRKLLRVYAVDDVPIRNIDEMKRCFDKTKQRYVKITFEDNQIIIFDTQGLWERSDRVAQTLYGAPAAWANGVITKAPLPPEEKHTGGGEGEHDKPYDDHYMAQTDEPTPASDTDVHRILAMLEQHEDGICTLSSATD